MRIAITALTVALCACLSACAITEPVVVIGPHGQTLKGVTRATMSSGTFNVTDGTLKCAGSYNPMDMSVTISAQIL